MKKTSPQTDSSSGHLIAVGMLGFGAWLLLAIYFLVPPRDAMSWALDSSNYGSYAWMFATGRQFGADTVAMTGPFGFLAYGHTYSGYLFSEYFAGDFLFKAAFALLVLRVFAQRGTGIWRWWWLLSLLIFLPSVDDLIYDIAILVAAVALLNREDKKAVDLTTALASVLLGFSVLMKGSHATLAGASVIVAALGGLLTGNRQRALAIAAIALATFLGGWLGAGQHLQNLPGYFHALFALTSGYNQVMGLTPEPRLLAAGLAVAMTLSLTLLLHALVVRGNPSRGLWLLFFSGFSFLQWKHGFVRADGHVYMFFGFAAVATPLLQMTMGRDDPPSASRRKISWAAAIGGLASFVLAAAATSSFSATRFGQLLSEVPAGFERHARYVMSPQRVKQRREAELQHQKQMAELADIRRDVGQYPIDFLGYEQGILLLNGLNYQPRPMGGGSFNVYHPHLQKLNERFMRDPSRRPGFILLKLQTVDRRLPAADDPLTLQALLAFYQPVRAQRDYVLFERAPAVSAATPRPLAPRSVKLGEWVPVPEVGADELLLFSVEATASLGGAIRGMVYRPPLLMLDVATDAEGAVETFRFPPLTARVPVLLSPLLLSNTDVVSLYAKKTAGKNVRQIRFRAPDGGFAESASVSFYSLPKPMEAPLTAAAEITTYLQHPLSNRPPVAISTQATGITELFGEPITLVHAPGAITFPVTQNDRQVIFNFGLMPQAYAPGETDGVEFIVEYLRGEHPPQLLFSRLLQPRTVPKDRGTQWARVFFPPEIEPGIVRFRTERGPAGNGAWDQSYVTHVQIESGPFDSRQLAGFSLSPEPPGFPDPQPTLLDGREVRLLPPPGEVTFAIPPGSKIATVGIGVLPAAYEGENHSDGIGCALVVILPDGSERLLVRRVLDPVHDRQARGTVTLDLELPTVPDGSRLALRMDGGPKQDLQSDLSYVQTVRFR